MKQWKNKKGFWCWIEKDTTIFTRVADLSAAFQLAVFVILTWAMAGPTFKFFDAWQLVINTGTTIVLFLVFYILQTQNKGSLAMEVKLNQLIPAEETANNCLTAVNELTQDKFNFLKKFYIRHSNLEKERIDLHSTHAVDGTRALHEYRQQMHKMQEPKEQ